MKYKNPNDLSKKTRKPKSLRKKNAKISDKVKTIERQVAIIKGETEHKHFYVFSGTPALIPAQNTGAPTAIELLNKVQLGTQSNERVGDIIRFKYVDIRLFFDYSLATLASNNGPVQTWARVILFMDKQADGVVPPPAEVLALENNLDSNLNVLSQQNMQYAKRYDIIHDEIFQIGLGSYDTYATLSGVGSGFTYGNMGAGPLKIIKIGRKFNCNVSYVASTPAVADLNKCSLWLWAFDEAGKNIRMAYNYTLSYVDM